MGHSWGFALQVPVTSFPGHILVVLQYSDLAQSLLEVHLLPSVAWARSRRRSKSREALMKGIMRVLLI